MLVPEIGTLNNFMAFNLERSLKIHQENLMVMYRQFYTMISEFYYNYLAFAEINEVF